jgi:ubiquitin-like modifier-activating enzyme ATG7
MSMLIKFDLPSARVENEVWMWLAKEKLDRLKLSTDPIRNRQGVHIEAKGSCTQLVVTEVHQPDMLFETTLINVNTAKDFRELDRKQVFEGHSKELLEHPVIPRVYVMSFADLKSYNFTYNVALPTIGPDGYEFEYKSHSLKSSSAIVFGDKAGRAITVLSREGNREVEFSPSIVCDGDIIVIYDRVFCSDDPIALPFYSRSVLTSIASRLSPNSEIEISVRVVSESTASELKGVCLKPCRSVRLIPNWMKWTNPVTQQPTAVMSVDLKRFMDPVTIAADSVALNIKLMKWRLLPGLEPEKMSNLRFLLIGAGTLGCAVARCLLAWGVSHITFVDSGRVSYSNPARQWLFNLEDAACSAPKAATAARRLKEVLPSAHIQGFELAVPLPGHPVDLDHVESSLEQLETLVNNHDVVFMLTDSRESRWLPSLLVHAAPNAPLGVSVALGFDSYLVKIQSYKDQGSSCYFCNDVNAPTDQTAFRTLDQQCTVTRPGMAAIASCMAVELVASFAQSKDGFESKRTAHDESLLGALPDQIRGFLGTFQSFPAVTEKFPNCICCSDQILHAFREDKLGFLKAVVRDSNQLMAVSGLKEFTERVSDDVLLFDDEDD